MGAMIIAEIGDFSRFDSPDKILAYAGMSPSTYQSGQLDNCYPIWKNVVLAIFDTPFTMRLNMSAIGMNHLEHILPKSEQRASIIMLLYPMLQRN